MGGQKAAGAIERPILFSGPMVRAILEGRKTQTRRVVKPQIAAECAMKTDYGNTSFIGHTGKVVAWMPGSMPPIKVYKEPGRGIAEYSDVIHCPYGQPGDRLWCREAWAYFGGSEYLYQQEKGAVSYRAERHDSPSKMVRHLAQTWKPSIHMPRWASRLTLEIVSVRVERVQDITENDCIAEGLASLPRPDHLLNEALASEPPWEWPRLYRQVARQQFAELWDSINAARGFGWQQNPWVWSIAFRVVPQNAQEAP